MMKPIAGMRILAMVLMALNTVIMMKKMKTKKAVQVHAKTITTKKRKQPRMAMQTKKMRSRVVSA